MSSKQRIKGNRNENKIVKLHQELGYHTSRVPLSGQVGGDYASDVIIKGIKDTTLAAEVKARAAAQGWVVIKKWLGDNDLLFLIEDRKEPLVVMPIETYKLLIGENK